MKEYLKDKFKTFKLPPLRFFLEVTWGQSGHARKPGATHWAAIADDMHRSLVALKWLNTCMKRERSLATERKNCMEEAKATFNVLIRGCHTDRGSNVFSFI